MQGLSSILSQFFNKFNKFKITRTRMFNFLSYGVKITLKSHFCRTRLRFNRYLRNVVVNVIS